MVNRGNLIPLLGFLCLVVALLFMGYGPDRSHFVPLLMAYSLGFLGLTFLYRNNDIVWSGKKVLILGLALRLCLLFSTPGLSDDVYRFMWDGHCIHAGINPYSWKPTELLAVFPGISDQWLPLFQLLNSPDYYSVYPPLSQALFALSTAFTDPSDLFTPILILRFILLLGEFGLLSMLPILLVKFNLPIKRSLLYAANPLVILEITGNLHFEGLVLTCLAIAALFAIKYKDSLTKIKSMLKVIMPFSLSIGLKLTPLLLVPIIATRLPKSSIFKATSIFILLMLFLFSPFLWTISRDGFLQSIDLYMRSFEFNASIYYLFRWIGYSLKGYNLISILGPLLAMLSLMTIVIIAINHRAKKINYALLCMWSYLIYLGCSTTVHPWYILIPMCFSLFTSWRFPIIWSWSVFLSYSAYQSTPVQEIPLATALVYVIPLGYALWEWTLKRHYSAGEILRH